MPRAICQASFIRSSGANDSQSSSHSSPIFLVGTSSWFDSDDENTTKGIALLPSAMSVSSFPAGYVEEQLSKGIRLSSLISPMRSPSSSPAEAGGVLDNGIVLLLLPEAIVSSYSSPLIEGRLKKGIVHSSLPEGRAFFCPSPDVVGQLMVIKGITHSLLLEVIVSL